MTEASKRTRARLLSLALLCALGAFGAALVLSTSNATGGGKGGDGGSGDEPLRELKDMRTQLEAAQDDENQGGEDYDAALKEAVKKKRSFYRAAFDGAQIHGSCDVAELLLGLDRIDVALEKARLASGNLEERKKHLRAARAAARASANEIDDCANRSEVKAQAGRILTAVQGLVEASGSESAPLTDEQLSQASSEVKGDKVRIVGVREVGKCRLSTYFILLEEIDTSIAQLQMATERARREEEIVLTLTRTRELIQIYKKDRPCSGSSPNPSEEDQALGELKDLRIKLEDAQDDGDKAGKAYEEALSDGGKQKRNFVNEVFGGKPILGSCDAAATMLALDAVDVALLEAAVDDRGNRGKHLTEARTRMRGLSNEIDECSDVLDIQDAARQILNQVEELVIDHNAGALTDDDLQAKREEIAAGKRFLLSGSKVGNCDVLEYFRLIDTIDQAIGLAQRAKSEEVREQAIEAAQRATRDLIRRYKRARPCGGSSPEPPPEEEPSRPISLENQVASNHPNGFGNAPSFECNRAKLTPARAGVQVTDQITRPDGTQVTKQAITNSNGIATISSQIDQPGDYVHTATATVEGQTVTDTDTNSVTAQDNGSCPPATP